MASPSDQPPVQRTRHGIKVLYMSGYTDDAILRHGVLDDETRFVSKPFSPDDLRSRVREMLDDDR